jgi:hypothetical protein
LDHANVEVSHTNPAKLRYSPILHSPSPPKTVIAGLDPAIQKTRMNAAALARNLDCRVKPGNDG